MKGIFKAIFAIAGLFLMYLALTVIKEGFQPYYLRWLAGSVLLGVACGFPAPEMKRQREPEYVSANTAPIVAEPIVTAPNASNQSVGKSVEAKADKPKVEKTIFQLADVTYNNIDGVNRQQILHDYKHKRGNFWRTEEVDVAIKSKHIHDKLLFEVTLNGSVIGIIPEDRTAWMDKNFNRIKRISEFDVYDVKDTGDGNEYHYQVFITVELNPESIETEAAQENVNELPWGGLNDPELITSFVENSDIDDNDTEGEYHEFELVGESFKNPDGTDRQTLLEEYKNGTNRFAKTGITSSLIKYKYKGETAFALFGEQYMLANVSRDDIPWFEEHLDRIELEAVDITGGGVDKQGRNLSYGVVILIKLKPAAVEAVSNSDTQSS